MRSPFQRRRTSWAVPVAVAGAIAVGSWITTATAGASTPNLPSISAAQLLVKAAHPKISVFSGQIDFTANLGLPDLTSVTGGDTQSTKSTTGFDPMTLLSGTHHINVWADGHDLQRLSLPSSLAETDFVHNGNNAYIYSSDTQTVTHLVTAAKSAADHHVATGRINRRGADTASGAVPMTPEQVAQQFLDHIGPSTTVRVAAPVYVAKQASYRLLLSPKAGTSGAAASTVRQVAITVDAKNGMVLSVSVLAKGSKAPALKVAFQKFSTSPPPASLFAIPKGVTTKTETIGGKGVAKQPVNNGFKGSLPLVTGAPWAKVVTFDHARLGASAKKLDAVTTTVHGPFGSAQLLDTSLVNALVFPNGKIVVGFVTPGALEAAAAG